MANLRFAAHCAARTLWVDGRLPWIFGRLGRARVLRSPDTGHGASGIAPPKLTVGTVAGNEDTAIPLNIATTAGASNETLTLRISGLPFGANLSVGTKNGDGTWTLTPAQLQGMTLNPPAGFDGNVSLGVEVHRVER
jgi:hypothetical protein